MQNVARAVFSAVFAVPGAVFALAGLVMTVVQLPPDPQVRPLGPLFLHLGLVHFFVGLSFGSRSGRVRVMSIALAVANGVAVGVTVALWLLSLPVWWALPASAALMLASWLIARRHPEYVHAAEMTALPSRPAPSLAPQAAPERSALAGPAAPVGFSAFLAKASRAQRRRALLIGLAVMLGTVIVSAGFGLFQGREIQQTLAARGLPGGESMDLFAVIAMSVAGLFVGLMFGLFAALLVLVAAGGGSLVNTAYSEFARRVHGALEGEEQSFAGVSFSFPERVAFFHGHTPVRLEIEVISSAGGEQTVCYSYLTFRLPAATDFQCRISRQGLMAQLRPLVGLQDVRLGWPVFDDQFVVETNDEGLVNLTITREVQEELLRFRQWLRQSSSAQDLAELRILEADLRLAIEGLLMTAEHLMAFYQSAGRIYDDIERHL
jgi:hypothetical protein